MQIKNIIVILCMILLLYTVNADIYSFGGVFQDNSANYWWSTRITIKADNVYLHNFTLDNAGTPIDHTAFYVMNGTNANTNTMNITTSGADTVIFNPPITLYANNTYYLGHGKGCTISGNGWTCAVYQNRQAPKPTVYSVYDLFNYTGRMYSIGGTMTDEISNSTWLHIKSVGLTNASEGGEEDTTPPSITDVNQDPSNATVTNVLENHLYINATITDSTGIDTVYLELNKNNSFVYINGTLKGNQTYSEDNITGDVYNWYLDETDLFSGTYNLDPDIVETTDHKNTTLQGLNTWLKIRFFNVSNSVQQSFIEYYSENATATGEISQYYYCNSNYSTGNPTLSQWCTLFYDNYNNLDYSHTHKYGKSKHKIFPLGINTTSGTINNVYVTETSYILKRGTPLGDRVYYVDTITRADTTQLSISNGNSYSNQAYTVDSHIHQVRDNENINYRIYANDTLGNSGYSSWYFDIIEFPLLPPNTVNFFSPIDTTYTGNSIIINHTESLSASGQTIIGYKYYYSVEGENNYLLLGENTHPITNFTWDVENILNNEYRIKVITTDNLNYTSSSYSSNFTLTHSYTVDQQFLNSIDTTLDSIEEVFKLIPLILIYIFFMWMSFTYIRTGSILSGIILYVFTLGLDAYITYWLIDNYVRNNSATGWDLNFIGIFGFSLSMLIIVKLLVISTMRYRRVVQIAN